MSFSASNFTTQTDRTAEEPASDVLPEGSGTFALPASIASSGFTTQTTKTPGVSAFGLVRRGVNTTPGVVELLLGGSVVASTALPPENYELAAVPSGVTSGGDVSRVDYEVRFRGEDGSAASKTFTTNRTEFDVNLGTLTVNVTDVNGDPVVDSAVTVDGADQSSDSDGQVVIGASGTATVTALGGSSSKDVSVPGGGSASVSFQYAGVQGRLRDADNRGIRGATVKLIGPNDTVIRRTKTDGSGNYEIARVPIDSDVEIEVGGINRDFTSPGEGTMATKNLPFSLSDIASISVTCVDAQNGDAIRGTTVVMPDTDAVTDSQGRGRGVSLSTGDVTMTVAAGDSRYQTVTVTRNVSGGATEDVEVTLERAQNSPTT